MGIHVSPSMTLPVELPLPRVRFLASGRIRAVLMPTRKYERLQRDDLLWLRESITVDERRSTGSVLVFRYAGDAKPYELNWPAVQARPGSGIRPAEAMPIVASRWTLQVRMVTTMRLSQLDEESAISCGADPTFGGGFVPVGAIEGFQPFGSAAECERFVWDSRFGQGAAAKNPEVVLIQFRALSRNIADLVPGMGKGGVL